jgi:hypothetical protein
VKWKGSSGSWQKWRVPLSILNYSTTIAPERTVAEIIGILSRKGARSITQDFYDDGRHRAVSFILVVGGLPTRFLLPVNVDGVAGVMLKDKPYNPSRSRESRDQHTRKMREKAEWVSWRILKDWVEAQMALIESGQAEPAQVFLPYVVERNGRTMYELFIEANQQKALGSGDGNHGDASQED